MGRRSTNEIVIIMWRDIPAQINGRLGDDKHGVVLPHRFQKAIDRAAMVAGKKTAQEYVAEWRRTSQPVTGELVACVEAVAASVDSEFTNDRLLTFVDNGGWDPESAEHATSAHHTSEQDPT